MSEEVAELGTAELELDPVSLLPRRPGSQACSVCRGAKRATVQVFLLLTALSHSVQFIYLKYQIQWFLLCPESHTTTTQSIEEHF